MGTTEDLRRRGFWMRMAREFANLSQETAARELGLSAKSKSTLSAWEAGTREPTGSVVAQMAALYGVPVDFLIDPPMTAYTAWGVLSVAFGILQVSQGATSPLLYLGFVLAGIAGVLSFAARDRAPEGPPA